MKDEILLKYISDNDGKIDLKEELVLKEVIFKDVKNSDSFLFYSLDDILYIPLDIKPLYKDNDLVYSLDSLGVRYLKVNKNQEVEVIKDTNPSNYYKGYFNEEWTDLFSTRQHWTGGDGIYSFNLNGLDNFKGNKDSSRTLFIFGDTFMTSLSPTNNRRMDPIIMINNSYSILEGNKPLKDNIKFFINQDSKGHTISYLNVSNPLGEEGELVTNLVKKGEEGNYLSSFNPKEDIEIDFKLNKKYFIENIEIINYKANEEDELFDEYQKRGVKKLYYSLDNKDFIEVEVPKGGTLTLHLNKEINRFKIIIPSKVNIGNYGGTNDNEPLFGLKRVRFNTSYHSLEDISVKTNSELYSKSKNSWFWLQDGIILDKYFYSFPLVISSNLEREEGFQFDVEGIAMTKTPLNSSKTDLVFSKTKQKRTNLLTNNLVFGSCIFDNSFTSQNKNKDGYIYLYGYKNNGFDPKELVVARVKKEDFTNLDEYQYFNGEGFTSDISNSKGILSHISTEFSIFEVDDKYLLVFTYDVQSRYVCYSIGDTPYGPFSYPHIAYIAQENLCSKMYIYNAKGHQHLSSKDEILVSYNINTSSFDENIKYGLTYGPRFIKLVKEKNL